MVAVTASGVTVTRGGRVLLDDVSLEVAAGSIVGIVGPNGAGKTTLLRVIAGDVHPDRGRATIGDLDVSTAGLRRLATLRAFSGPQLAGDISFRVGEVVAMGLHPTRDPGNSDVVAGDVVAGDVVAGAMTSVDVASLQDREMRTLSSGEQQRVHLARAIAQQTPVLLLDEPTSALDVGHQETVMAVLKSLSHAGVTVVAVLHDLNLAAAHADSLLLLDSGRAVAVGPPRDVLTGERLSAVYKHPMQAIDHPLRDCPLILTLGD